MQGESQSTSPTAQAHAEPHQPSGAEPAPILVTGATGYVGGRLVPRLLDAGYAVRCLVRSPRKLQARPWNEHPKVEIVQGDAANEEELVAALEGCRIAYYLIHSMVAAGPEYAERDRRLAETFACAAKRAGIERILYLGGLGETGEDLSEHLTSRREVEKALAQPGVSVTVLRAAMIIGSGSASFEILRYLVERLPAMVTPRWVKTECQPISIRNVLDYLIGCLEVPETAGRTLDIGGSDVLTYLEMMHIMAEERGLRRRIILPVPVLTPSLSSHWIHFVTPLSKEIARPLAEGLRNRVVMRNRDIEQLVPIELMGVREAIWRALGNTAKRAIKTSWTDAGSVPGDPDWAGGTTFVDRREQKVDASPGRVFWAVCRIGGGNGWYAADYLWRLRGFLDQMAGGPGLRRGRRDPERLGYGDALDFWRVTDIAQDRRLALRAEMKLPGEALLAFTLEPTADGQTLLIQTARFRPRGLLGLLYWVAVLPFHGIVFSGMLGGIQRAAEHDEDAGRVRVARQPRPGKAAARYEPVERPQLR
ncbi:MAG: SDR family oxidoreductase [Acidobacteriota bacterium]